MFAGILAHHARNFYPRSPQGERPSSVNVSTSGSTISIHALRKESDGQNLVNGVRLIISIHALRKESDHPKISDRPHNTKFLSTLSARRATRETVPGGGHIIFLSTLSARRATLGRVEVE